MAQEENNAQEKKGPKLIKRGNEDIDFDLYANLATIELDRRLAHSNLNDEEKDAVRQHFSQILEGMANGTFEYKIGGGYNNSVGLTNTGKGNKDSAGIAAGILGSVLRNQAAYTPPVEKPDITKTSYSGTKTIGTKFLDDVLGEAKNIQYFVNQDQLVDGKRGQANRIKIIQDYLNDVASEGNWDRYFTGYSPEQKDKWFKDYETYGKNIDINNNGIIDENEYLALSRLLGLDNIEHLLFTGETYNPQLNTAVNAPVYTNEEEYLNAIHPRSSKSVLEVRDLSSKRAYFKEGRDQLWNILYRLPRKSLLNIVKYGMESTPTGGRMNKINHIYEGFGKRLTSFENNYILSQALEVLRQRGYISPLSTDSNTFYLPIEDPKLDEYGIGLVYKINPNGKSTVEEVDRRDLPYFTNTWHQDFLNQVPSKKNGGTLRKFQSGGKASGVLKFDPTRNNMYYTGDFTGYDNWHANNIVLPWLNAYKDAGDQDWETLIKSGLDSWNNAGGFDWYNATDEQKRHGMQSAGTQTHQQYIIDNLPGLNTEIAKHVSEYNVPVRANTNDRFINGTLKGTDTDFGIQTGNRRPSIHVNTSGQALADWDTFYKNLGYAGRYQYLDHWVPTKNANQKGLVAFAALQEPDVQTSSEETTEQTGDATDIKKFLQDYLKERQTPYNNKPSYSRNILQEIAPNLIGSGRLIASLYSNKKIYNDINPAITPIIQDPINLHRPVLGNFAMQQALKKRGAEVMFRAYQNADSDPDRNAARMLEAENINLDANTKANLIDNEAIKKSDEARFNLMKELALWNKTNVYMPNRANINKANREKAELKASYHRSNWESLDNFLQGLESDWRKKSEDYELRRNNFYDKIDQDEAQQLLSAYKTQAQAAASKWMNSPEGKNSDGTAKDITLWPLYPIYSARIQQAEDMAKARLYSRLSQRYNWNYNSPYTDDEISLFFDRGWTGN